MVDKAWVQVSIRVPGEMHHRLRVLAMKRRQFLYQLITEAVAEKLAARKSVGRTSRAR